MARYEKFWDTICEYSRLLRIVFMVFAVLFVLSVISLWLGTPGTGSYAIATINFVLASIFALITAWMNRVCSRREREYY